VSDIGELAIEHALAMQPSLLSSLRYVGDRPELAGEVSHVLCTGIEQRRGQTDQGMMTGADGLARYALKDEPQGWRYSATRGIAGIVGQTVELTLTGADRAVRCRVDGRREMAGGVRLNLMAEFAEQ